jgi:hypothetical protein
LKVLWWKTHHPSLPLLLCFILFFKLSSEGVQNSGSKLQGLVKQYCESKGTGKELLSTKKNEEKELTARELRKHCW